MAINDSPENEKMKIRISQMAEILKIASADTISVATTPTVVHCDCDEQSAVGYIETEAWMKNPNGVLHGGIIATVFDTAMGIVACYYGGERMTQTISMQISYLRPGVVGERLYLRCTATKSGKNVQFINAEAWSGEDEHKLIATANTVYYTVGDLPKTLKTDSEE